MNQAWRAAVSDRNGADMQDRARRHDAAAFEQELQLTGTVEIADRSAHMDPGNAAIDEGKLVAEAKRHIRIRRARRSRARRRRAARDRRRIPAAAAPALTCRRCHTRSRASTATSAGCAPRASTASKISRGADEGVHGASPIVRPVNAAIVVPTSSKPEMPARQGRAGEAAVVLMDHQAPRRILLALDVERAPPPRGGKRGAASLADRARRGLGIGHDVLRAAPVALEPDAHDVRKAAVRVQSRPGSSAAGPGTCGTTACRRARPHRESAKAPPGSPRNFCATVPSRANAFSSWRSFHTR